MNETLIVQLKENYQLLDNSKKTAGLITDFLNDYSSNGRILALCQAMTTEHRTLQQNFTSLCIKWIFVMAGNDPDFNKLMDINSESDFYRRFLDGRNEYSHKVCKKIADSMKEEGINSNLPCI